MSIKERLLTEMKTAMKARDTLRLSCVRMLRSKIQEKEVAQRTKHGRDHQIGDDDAIDVISTYAKQRRDSIEAYTQGGRDDLAAKETAELAIVEEFLPQQLTADELRTMVQEAITESGAASPKEMGAVMKLVVPKVKGRADGKQVSQPVRELLSPEA